MAGPRRRTVRDLRRNNRATVLRKLYFDGPLSRQELGPLTALSSGSISNVVSELDRRRPPGGGRVGRLRRRQAAYAPARRPALRPPRRRRHRRDTRTGGAVRPHPEGARRVWTPRCPTDSHDATGRRKASSRPASRRCSREAQRRPGRPHRRRHRRARHRRRLRCGRRRRGRRARAGHRLGRRPSRARCCATAVNSPRNCPCSSTTAPGHWVSPRCGSARAAAHVTAVVTLIGSGVGACVIADGVPYQRLVTAVRGSGATRRSRSAAAAAGAGRVAALRRTRVPRRCSNDGARAAADLDLDRRGEGRWPNSSPTPPAPVNSSRRDSGVPRSGHRRPRQSLQPASASSSAAGPGSSSAPASFEPVRRAAAAYALRHPYAQTTIELGRLGPGRRDGRRGDPAARAFPRRGRRVDHLTGTDRQWRESRFGRRSERARAVSEGRRHGGTDRSGRIRGLHGRPASRLRGAARPRPGAPGAAAQARRRRRGWLVVGHEEARAALTDPRLVKSPAKWASRPRRRADRHPSADHRPARAHAAALPRHPRLHRTPRRVAAPAHPAHHRRPARRDARRTAAPTSSSRSPSRCRSRSSASCWVSRTSTARLPAHVDRGGRAERPRRRVRGVRGTRRLPARPDRGQAGAGPADDLLSALIRTTAEDGDRLSPDELCAMAFMLLIAGHETTVNLIAAACAPC